MIPRLIIRDFFSRGPGRRPPTDQEIELAVLDIDFADALFLCGFDPDRATEICAIYDGAMILLMDAKKARHN